MPNGQGISKLEFIVHWINGGHRRKNEKENCTVFMYFINTGSFVLPVHRIHLTRYQPLKYPPQEGHSQTALRVSLTCATSGAKIYYTTDDSEPGESSTAYSAPFKVTSSLTVKARAFLDGMDPSDVSSAGLYCS